MQRSNNQAVQSALECRLGYSKRASDNELRFNCPKCKHDDYRLYVNPDRIRTDFFTGRQRQGWFLCFECHWRGPLEFLCQALGIDVEDFLASPDELRQRLMNYAPMAEEGVPQLHFPDKIPVLINDLAREYMVERGLTDRQIIDSGIFIRIEDGYTRIYFPEFDLDGGIRYCVSRRYLEDDNWPKYMSAGSSKQRGVYRLAECEEGAEITLVEGPLDALVQWENTAALYGTFLSDRQLKMLNSVSDKFLIALDADAYSFAAELGEKLMDRGKQVRVAILPPGEDPASLGRERFAEICKAAKVMTDGGLIRLKMGLTSAGSGVY